METLSGDGSKTELVMKKEGEHKSTTGSGVSLTQTAGLLSFSPGRIVRLKSC